MKRLLLILTIALFATSVASAQTGEQTTLRLRSGVEITGVIIEHNSDGSVMIQTDNGDKFYYRMDEVAQIGNKEVKRPADKGSINGNFKGYRGIVEVSGAGSAGSFDGLISHILSASMINGYSFGSLFYAGIGVGLSLSEDGCYSIPIYLHLRSAFLKNTKISPYVSFNIGYAIGCNESLFVEDYNVNYYYISSGGFYIEPTFGAEIRLKNKKAVTIGLTMPLIPKVTYGGEKYGECRKLLSIGGKIGFSF